MSNRYIYEPSKAKIGFGTSTLRDQSVLLDYLRAVNEADYDFIDCAWRYGNEALIGLALKHIKREDVNFEINVAFQSKVWPTQFFGGITKSLKFTLQKIGAISTIDAYMLHRPSHDMELNLSAWKQLIECKNNRLTRTIGLGHFDKDLIEKFFEHTEVRPDFLQVELSVNNMRYDRIFYCRQHDIEIQAYEPLGDFENNEKNPLIVKMAEKYDTSIKNLLLAFLLNQGIVPIVVPESLEEIQDLVKSKNIVLEAEDIVALQGLNTYKNKHFETLELDFKDEA